MREREDLALFSKRRAIRGSEIGAVGGVASPIVLVGAAVLVDPAALAETVQLIYQHPTEHLQFLGLHTACWSAVGAAIDGFRPTSKLVQRWVERQIETFKIIKGDLIRVSNWLRNFDFPRW